MINRLRDWLRHITGISTPFGGVSWSGASTWVGRVPIFREPIHITYPKNSEFISFLEANREKIVCLDTCVDASVATKAQDDLVRNKKIDLDLITSGSFSGALLPLPNSEGNLVDLCFYFIDDHVLKYSSGGTGIITVAINGFFEVTRTLHGGPSRIYYLKELPAPLEAKVDIQNQ